MCKPPRLANLDGISLGIREEQVAGWLSSDSASGVVEVHRHDDCWLAPRGLLLSDDGVPLRDGHDEEEISEARTQIAAATDSPRIDGPAILLVGPGQTAYGHWLVEILPALAVISQVIDVGGCRVMIPRVENRLLSIYLEAVASLGAERVETVRNVLFKCEEVVTVEGLSRTGQSVSPLVLGTFASIGDQVEPAGAERLFLSRQGVSQRRVANFEAVQPVLDAHGFDVIEPEQLSLSEQVAHLKAARVIAGPMGSALSGIAFSSPGAKVLSLAPTGMLDTFFWRLANLCGHDYYELRCPVWESSSSSRSFDRDIVIDPILFDRWLSLAAAG
jgi:capsular polysaccharide biosynthesis protein